MEAKARGKERKGDANKEIEEKGRKTKNQGEIKTRIREGKITDR